MTQLNFLIGVFDRDHWFNRKMTQLVQLIEWKFRDLGFFSARFAGLGAFLGLF